MLLLATVANDPAVFATVAPLVVARSAGRADHLQDIDDFLHFTDDCSLRCGWRSRHPERNGRRHLWENPTKRAALQWGPRHLREPRGAVHPRPENCEWYVCADRSHLPFFSFHWAVCSCLCCLRSLVPCIISLQSVLCAICHLRLFNLASVDPRCAPQTSGVLLSSVWGAWRQQAS